MHNPRVLRFLGIMAAAYAVWFVTYDLWLLPDGRLDAWLSTRVAHWSSGLLGLFGIDTVVRDRQLWMGETGIELIAECNGLAVLSLFVGFVLAFPGKASRRAWFIPLGVGVIVLANVIRCAVLLVLLSRSESAFHLAHGSGGLLMFYAIVFALWWVWSEIGGADDAEPPPAAATSVPALAS